MKTVEEKDKTSYMTSKSTDCRSDWTLDTNVLVVANGRKSSELPFTGQPTTPPPRSQVQVTRELLNCISRTGCLCWSTKVAQEYIARGVLSLRQSRPPVPVQNQQSMTWVDHWLARPEMQRRLYYPKITPLTGSEQDNLRKRQFRDMADYRFLELARSSSSRRLVTQEAHYNTTTKSAIKYILDVVCLDYQTAVEECHQ